MSLVASPEREQVSSPAKPVRQRLVRPPAAPLSAIWAGELDYAEAKGFLEDGTAFTPEIGDSSPEDFPPGARITTLGESGKTYHGYIKSLSDNRVELILAGNVSLPPKTALLIQLDEVPSDLAPTSGPSMVLGTYEHTAPLPDNETLCTISLERPLSKQVERKRQGPLGRAWVVPGAVFILGVIAYAKYFNYHWFWYDPVFQTYSIGVALYIVTRAILSMYYRTPRDENNRPSLTVVIAVKNEEDNIEPTIDHCYRSEYPHHLLDVIVIDDGSTDATWEKLKACCRKYPTLTVYRFGKNKGKRHAMALGAVKARGDILVYIDSDSFVERQSIARIVQPFVDPTIGAVAGHIQIIVNPMQILSKMERVRYFVSHRVIKACESMFGAVTCCSGAFSAYRRSAVMSVLEPWLRQTFLGTRATFGDDRSLTNHVLRHYQVIFNDQAICWTYVPDRWDKFFRQQLRWKKSWTRETIAAAKIMWRKHPVAAFGYYMGVIMTLISPLIVLRAVVFMPLVAATSALPYLLGLVLVYLFFCLVFRYHTESRYWAHGLGFAFLYIGVLCWQNYYAMVTVNRTHWGTR